MLHCNVSILENDLGLFSLDFNSEIIQVDSRPEVRKSLIITLSFFLTWSWKIIDLRTAQVYWDAIFLVSQEVYLNFHHFCG